MRAIRLASMAQSKQSEGEWAASTGNGQSPCLAYRLCNKSLCSVFVGRPVLGPPRCTSTITTGNSVIEAKPINSLFKHMPGPLVATTDKSPAKLAPMAMPMAAISSSACNVLTPNFFRAERPSKIGEAGVMGYPAYKSLRPDCFAPATSP